MNFRANREIYDKARIQSFRERILKSAEIESYGASRVVWIDKSKSDSELEVFIRRAVVYLDLRAKAGERPLVKCVRAWIADQLKHGHAILQR